MTLKRLLIVVTVLVVLAGGGMLWLARVAYTPQGRARIIIAQLKGDKTSLHGWLLKNHIAKPGFVEPQPVDLNIMDVPAPPANCYPRNRSYQPLIDDSEMKLAIFFENRAAVASDEIVKCGPEIMPLLIEALEDDDRLVRMMAVSACGRIHDPSAVKPLVKCMLRAANDPFAYSGNTGNTVNIGNLFSRHDFAVQCLCMNSLVEIGSEAFGPLIEGSRQCEAFVRWQLPEALAKKWGVAAVPPLIELLGDSASTVRSSAAEKLGDLKDSRSIPALKTLLNDLEFSVRYSAGMALRKLGVNTQPASEPHSP